MDIGDLLKNPDKLKEALRRAIGNNDKKLAETLIPIVRNPELTYLYAAKIIKGKIKDEWEDIIAQDDVYSFYYARNILNGPFPKGEDVIAQDPYSSYYYAKDVLNGPFPKGEDAIATNRDLPYYYAKEILKDRFRKGEKAIINYGRFLKEYIEFLKEIGKLDEFLKDHPEVKEEN